MKSAKQFLIESARKIIIFPEGRIKRHDYELAFLPATLEATEAPPSPTGRAIGAVIIAAASLALIWASLGTVDIVTTAPGRIIPTGRTKTIQPFETGVVSVIHVRDGQTVKAGEPLIELDPTMSEAEASHVKSDLVAAQMEVARIQALLGSDDDPVANFRPPKEASPALVSMNQGFLASQSAEHKAALNRLDGEMRQKQAERDTVAATIEKLEATIPLLEQRVGVRRYLFDKALGSKLTYLTEYQDLIGQKQDLAIQKSRYREAEQAVETLSGSRSQADAEFRRTLFAELAVADQKATALAQDAIKAERRAKLQVLVAPIDGVVQQLAIHTVGGVVTAAQPLLTLVPQGNYLEIDANVSNRDVGFVRAGQDAEIKVDTFNFTRYGLVHGKVLSVSQDAIARDRSHEVTQGADGAASEDFFYAARVSLDRGQMEVEERMVNLSPGMSVTVEIKTGTRRVIEYLLSPIARYKHDVMRER